MASKPILGYWNIRGLGQPIRLFLTYLGVDFEDRQYSTEDYGAEWYQVKYDLGLDFPSLPYILIPEENIKLTQTFAILRYFARKYGLTEITESEFNSIALLEHVLVDLNGEFIRVLYEKNAEAFETLKESLLESILPLKMRQLDAYMAPTSGRKWIAGQGLSYVDFYLYEQLIRVKVLAPTVYNKYENLVSFVDRFEELPAIREFLDKTEPMMLSAPWVKWNDAY